MNAIKNIKGTHDILPGEICKWQELEKIVVIYVANLDIMKSHSSL